MDCGLGRKGNGEAQGLPQSCAEGRIPLGLQAEKPAFIQKGRNIHGQLFDLRKSPENAGIWLIGWGRFITYDSREGPDALTPHVMCLGSDISGDTIPDETEIWNAIVVRLVRQIHVIGEIGFSDRKRKDRLAVKEKDVVIGIF